MLSKQRSDLVVVDRDCRRGPRNNVRNQWWLRSRFPRARVAQVRGEAGRQRLHLLLRRLPRKRPGMAPAGFGHVGGTGHDTAPEPVGTVVAGRLQFASPVTERARTVLLVAASALGCRRRVRDRRRRVFHGDNNLAGVGAAVRAVLAHWFLNQTRLSTGTAVSVNGPGVASSARPSVSNPRLTRPSRSVCPYEAPGTRISSLLA